MCFFHLGQCFWRKVQGSGLASQYGNDEEFSLLLRHICALAFLPPDEITKAFDILKQHLPQQTKDVADWFQNNYIHGRIRRHLRDGTVVRASPLFPPTVWTVYDSIKQGIPRTQNVVEAWHRRWECLIGRAHVGFYRLITEFQKEQQQVNIQAECILRGEPTTKPKKSLIDRENRIMTLIKSHGTGTVMEYLRGIAHNLSF